MSSFKPNAMTFGQGIERINSALSKSAAGRAGGILTSRDDAMRSATKHLQVENIPDGFTKWQLPVYMDGPSQFFVSVGAPGTDVPEHSHDEGDGFRYVVNGSIIYNGQELTAGDWMFIPKGQRYSIKVGERGATMCYCYRCCCA